MDWPTPRSRYGGSRRDALARIIAAAASVAAVLIGLGILAVDRIAPERSAAARGLVSDAVAPLWQALDRPVALVEEAVATAGAYIDAADRVAGLEAERVVLRRQAIEATRLMDENARLRRLLRLAEPARRRVAVARIAGASSAGPIESAIVAVGSAEGVAPGMPVLSDAGLIGRVTAVGRHSARVLLVSDGGSRVPVRIARTGAPAMLAGTGGGMAELRFVERTEAGSAVRAGDIVFTSGEGGVFAPGIAVARIVAVAEDGALARPLARPATLGLAVIEAAWLPPVQTPAMVTR